MAYRRKFQKKKKTFKRKSMGTKRTYKAANISRAISTGFAPIVKFKHTYVNTKQLDSVTGAIGNYLWCCNGMYDPDITGTGHQPYYFDQMGAIYNHYTVIASRITVDFAPRSTDESVICVLSLNDDSTITPTVIDTLREMGSSKSLVLSYGAVRTRRLTLGWSMKKGFGSAGTLANSLLRGDTGNNPSETQNFCVSIRSTDSASTTAVFATVKIEYIAMWNELRDISGS